MKLTLTVPFCASCCDPCLWTGSLEVLFTQPSRCTGCRNDPFLAPGESWTINSLTLSGIYTLSYSSPGLWEATGVGAYSLTHYTGATDCTGASNAYASTIYISATCALGLFTVSAATENGPGGGVSAGLFSGAAAALNDSAANLLSCATNGILTEGGAVIVSKP